MASTEIITLPFPRAADIERQRAPRGRVERVAYLDDVAMQVAVADTGEAPICVAVGQPADGTPPKDVWRLHAGRLYRPLWLGWHSGADVAHAGRLISRTAIDAMEQKTEFQYAISGETLPGIDALRRADRSRGVGPDGHHPVRRVVDDGRRVQADHAASFASRLLLVEGILHHAAPPPGLGLSLRLSDGSGGLGVPRWRTDVTVEASCPYHDPCAPDTRKVEPAPWLAFPADARDEAEGCSQELVLRLRKLLPPGTECYGSAVNDRMLPQIVDAPRYAEALPPAGAAAWLRRVGTAYLAGVAGVVGHMSVGGVSAYLAARVAVESLDAGSDPEVAHAALCAFTDLAAAHLRPTEGAPPDPMLVAGILLRHRYEAYERHRSPTVGDLADADALAELAPTGF